MMKATRPKRRGQVAQSVERSPEKAGVGGSIPSLATTKSITYRPSGGYFHSISFQLNGAERLASSEMLTRIAAVWLSIPPVLDQGSHRLLRDKRAPAF